MKDIWEGFLTNQDEEVIRRGRYGLQRGLGQRPALLVIDCQYNHVGADAPILEQMDQWPSGVGEDGWRAVDKLSPVVAACRRAGVPVVYTRYCFPAGSAGFDAFSKKRQRPSSAFVAGSDGTRVVEPLTPEDGDLIVDKVHASAFHGTPLVSWLIGMGTDTLLMTGVSTSGCVRSTAVEAAALGFDVAVLADCVADRIAASHKAALLDLWMKYADLVDAQEAIEYVESCAG